MVTALDTLAGEEEFYSEHRLLSNGEDQVLVVLVLLCSAHIRDSQVIDAVDSSFNVVSLVHDLITDAFLDPVIS